MEAAMEYVDLLGFGSALQLSLSAADLSPCTSLHIGGQPKQNQPARCSDLIRRCKPWQLRAEPEHIVRPRLDSHFITRNLPSPQGPAVGY